MDSSVSGMDRDDSSSSQRRQRDGLPEAVEVPKWEAEKEQAIREACKWNNLDELRALAESRGGFLLDELRQQACVEIHTPPSHCFPLY